jgi:hypothetical protein
VELEKSWGTETSHGKAEEVLENWMRSCGTGRRLRRSIKALGNCIKPWRL